MNYMAKHIDVQALELMYTHWNVINLNIYV